MARLDGRVATALLLVAALTAHICFENLAQAERDEGKKKKAGTAIDAADANTTVATFLEPGECCGLEDGQKVASHKTKRKHCQAQCRLKGTAWKKSLNQPGAGRRVWGEDSECPSKMKCRVFTESECQSVFSEETCRIGLKDASAKLGKVNEASRSTKNDRHFHDDDDASDEEEEALTDCKSRNVEGDEAKKCMFLALDAAVDICNWRSDGTVNYKDSGPNPNKVKGGAYDGMTSTKLKDRLCELQGKVYRMSSDKVAKCKKLNNCMKAAEFTANEHHTSDRELEKYWQGRELTSMSRKC